MGPEWRPALKPEEFLFHGTEWLGVELGELRSRRRGEMVVRAREMLVLLGVERYGLRVADLARHLGKTPDGVTQAIRRAAWKKTKDTGFKSALSQLDLYLAGEATRKTPK